MQCPFCHQEHPDEAIFCTMTGKKLESISRCNNCESQLQVAWKVCPKCGTSVAEASSRAKRKKGSRLKKMILGISIGIVGFLLLIAVIAILDPFNLHLRGRIWGRYDATAALMPESTELYLGINLLRIKPGELERYSPLVIPLLFLTSAEDFSYLASNPAEPYQYNSSISPDNTSNAFTVSLSYPSQKPLQNSATSLDDISFELETQYGIRLPDDLYPWIGQFIGVGILDFVEGEAGMAKPRFVIAAESRSRRAADRFLAKIVDKISANQNDYVEQMDYRGAAIFVQSTRNGAQKLAFGRSGRLVLFALDDKTLKEAIDTQNSTSLANTPAFVKLLESLPSSQFINLYISNEMLETSSKLMGSAALLTGWNLLPATLISSWGGSMMTVTVADSHLQIDIFSMIDRSNLSSRDRRLLANFVSRGETADLMAAETLVYLPGTSPDLFWEAFSEVLVGAGDQEGMKNFVKKAENWLGVNLHEDLFKYLDGEWAFALLHSTESYWSQSDDIDLGYIFVARTADDKALFEAMKSHMDFIMPLSGDYFIQSNISHRPFYEFYSVTVEYPDVIFGVIEGYLILGSNRTLIEDLFIDRPSLSQSDPYQQVWRSTTEGASPVMYIDVQGLLQVIGEQLSATDHQSFTEAVQYLESVQSIAAVQYPLEGDIVRNTLFIFSQD